MKKIILLLSLGILVSLTVKAQSFKSGVIAGVSMDWYQSMQDVFLRGDILDKACSFHAGYQFQFDMKKKFSMDLALLYGQKRGKFDLGYGIDATDPASKNIDNKFARHYLSLNGVANYNLINNLKVGAGIEPTVHFREKMLFDNTVKAAFDIPLVVKAAYSFKHFDVALMYKHGFCNVMRGLPSYKGARARDLQLSVFVPLWTK